MYYKELYTTKIEPLIIHIVQGTNAIPLHFKIMDWEIPAGAGTNIYIKKPSGYKIYNAGTISNNSCVFNMTTQMTAETGVNFGQLEIVSGSKYYYSWEIVLKVLPSIVDSSAIQSTDEFTALQEAISRATNYVSQSDLLNYVPKTAVTGKGSTTRPVYFDASGIAQPMGGPLPIEYGGTGATEISTYTDDEGMTIYKWGKLVMLSYREQTPFNIGSPSSVPAGYRPVINLHFTCPIYRSSSSNANNFLAGYALGIVRSNDGAIEMQMPSGVDACPRFDIMYFTA